MSREFSIVIPYYATAQTLDFLKRQLNYYHFNQTPMAVILAVSGDEMVESELEQFIKEIDDPRFVMFRAERSDITSMGSLIKKIFCGLKMVVTPYVVINGADDVIIPEAICKGTEILANNLDVSAAKGYTIRFNCESGELLTVKDSENLDNCPVKRLKEAIKDRTSIFYTIRRIEDLVREYENIINLSKKSKIVCNSPYHIEHFKALSVAALGKVCVFKHPWRLYNVHNNNHTSYINASFLRVELGVIDKTNYEWFSSVNKNMNRLHYGYYKFLWICSQIRGVSVTLKQIAYHYMYKNCSLINSARIFIYFLLHKIFNFFKKMISNESGVLDNEECFFNAEQYDLLEKHYFSEKDLMLLASKATQNKFVFVKE